MKAISRRQLLGALGASTLALPWLEYFQPRVARAAGGSTPPKRLIVFYSPNGHPMEHWKCQVNGAPSNFTLSKILQPLAPHKQDCLFIEGVPMSSSFDPKQNATAHEGGNASVLTGSWAGPGNMFGGGQLTAGFSQGESVEHAIGRTYGKATRFGSYYFGVLPSIPVISSRMFYAGADEPISPNPDPWGVFEQLFGELALGPEMLKKRSVERARVLGVVNGELSGLRCKLGKEDKVRLDGHLAELQKLAKSLEKPIDSECKAPGIGNPYSINKGSNFPKLGKAQMDLLVQALKCDLTRTAALQWFAPGSGLTYSWLGHTEEHHELSHKTTTDAKQRLAEVGAWYSEQLAYLVDQLKNTPEGNGTLFDSTTILWVSEIGNPWVHDRHDVGFTLVGGCQGYFKTGRYLKYSGTEKDNHNRLLLSLLDCFGQGGLPFGAPQYSSAGPLTGLTA